MRWNWIFIGAISLLMHPAATAFAQRQATIGSPFNITTNSFFEQQGVNFGFASRGSVPLHGQSATVGLNQFPALTPGLNFQQNNAALPPFGGGVGNQPATLGFQVAGRNGTASFGLFGGQGSNSSIVSQSPSITVMDGQTGIFSDTSQRPFVTGLVPVVGENVFGGISLPPDLSPGGNHFRTLLDERLDRIRQETLGQPTPKNSPQPAANVNPGAAAADPLASINPAGKPAAVDPISQKLQRARDSSAGQPAASVEDIRRAQQTKNSALQREAEVYLDKAREAESAGKFGMAKIYYDMAAAKADGELKDRATAASRAMSGQLSRPREEHAPLNAGRPVPKSSIGGETPAGGLNAGRPVSDFQKSRNNAGGTGGSSSSNIKPGVPPRPALGGN